MKKILFFALCIATSFGFYPATAQEDKIKESKDEEIIIRKNGDKDVKVTVEIKDDKVLINGKPLSDFKDDDVAVMQRKKITRNGKNKFIYPGGPEENRFFPDGNEEGNDETRTFLGVTTEKTRKGVKIINVAKGSAAEKAGLKEGDVITKLGDKKIDDPENLMDAVKSHKPKEEVKIYYERNGKADNTKAVLDEKKVNRIRSFSFNNDDESGDFMKNFKFDMPKIHPMPAQPFSKFWMNSGKKLGVRIEDSENNGGAKITNVDAGSAAEKAGLKKDDLITEVNGKKVESVDEVREEVLQTDKDNFTIKAKRNGTEMNFEISIQKVNSADL